MLLLGKSLVTTSASLVRALSIILSTIVNPTMTTPAVDLNTTYQPTQYFAVTTWYCGGPPDPSGGTVSDSLRFVDYRQASISSYRTSSGWRNPTPWIHYGERSNYRITGGRRRHSNLCVDLPSQGEDLYNHPGWTVDSGGIGAGYPPSFLIDSADTKAYLALKAQKANFSVMFAERKETADLFSHAASDIAKGVRAFRGKYPKEWGQVLSEGSKDAAGRWKKMPQRWLELQYGWNPLMQDVSGACQELSKREERGNAYHVHVKGTSKHTETTSKEWYSDGVFKPCGQHIRGRREFQVTTRLYYTLDTPLLALFSSLGLTNPLELIWERVPYSFVVDWFIPVGGWLQSLDADFGWSFRIGQQSLWCKSTARGAPYGGVDGNYTFEGFFDPYQHKGFFSKRNILYDPPGVGLPHFKNPFSSTHIANAMSLLVSAFRR